MQNTLPGPRGQLVDVGGHHLHVDFAGNEGPLIVFEAGGASWSLDWHLVTSEVAKFARTCVYDRAGFGWSDPGPMPRSSAQLVEELHALLVRTGSKPPYILVGASFGGHVVRLFASRFPAEVAGMVLLDARHEALNDKMPSGWQRLEMLGRNTNRFLLFAARSGLLPWLGKLMGQSRLPPIVKKLPPELQDVYLKVGYQAKFFQANLDELAASTLSDAQVAEANPLGHLPLMVIRHGIPDLFVGMPKAQADLAERTWQVLQTELAMFSSQSQLLVAERSGHAIQIDQPDLVVQAIRGLVQQIC